MHHHTSSIFLLRGIGMAAAVLLHCFIMEGASQLASCCAISIMLLRCAAAAAAAAGVKDSPHWGVPAHWQLHDQGEELSAPQVETRVMMATKASQLE